MENRPRGHSLYVWVRPSERLALEAMAQREHRKLADMARECIRREAVRQEVWPETEDAK
jgi:hypothetical protein